jgi:hypothetical protein
MSTSQRPPDDWRPLSDPPRRAVGTPVRPVLSAPQLRTDYRSEPAVRSGTYPRSDGNPRGHSAVRPPRARADAESSSGSVLPLRRRDVHRIAPPGLTAPAAAALCAAPTLAGGLLDAVVFGHLSWLFGIGFIVGAVWQAGRLRVDDLVYAGIIPPLVFAGAALAIQQFLPAGHTGNLIVRETLDLASTLASSAPLLFAGTSLAVVLGLLRWRRERKRRMRRRPARRTRPQ